MLLTNSSTVERAFTVYAADGFNTGDGGYDVGAAAVAATDVGSWVTVEGSPVTVPALSTAVVPFTVTVPDGAAPGDHAGGIVVSPVQAETSGGVVVDTRVAVRLNVRVPGDITAALDVRDVGVSYGFTAVPFAGSAATVSYTVANTGNVKVVGVPRLRITGPFGVTLAEVTADRTREVLPGDSFTVTTRVAGVAPALVATATVDVAMTAAPGPSTQIPAVSATSRSTFLAVPWTGLVLLVLVAVGAWFLVRRVRQRRREGAQLWDRVVDEARADIEAGRGPRTSAVGTALGVAALAGMMVLGAAPHASADDSEGGAITITVPRPSPTPTPTPAATATPARQGSGAAASRPPRGASSAPAPDPSPAAPEPAVPGGGETEPPSASDDVPPPDLIWPDPGRRPWGVVQWSLAGAGGASGGAVITWAVRALVLTRRGVGA